jgi:hypothetical protein
MIDHDCSGPVYHFRSCLGCCARFVIAARPSRDRQDGCLSYLGRYSAFERQAILDKVKELDKC